MFRFKSAGADKNRRSYIRLLQKESIPVPKDDTHKSCVPHLDPLRDQKSSRTVAELRRAFR